MSRLRCTCVYLLGCFRPYLYRGCSSWTLVLFEFCRRSNWRHLIDDPSAASSSDWELFQPQLAGEKWRSNKSGREKRSSFTIKKASLAEVATSHHTRIHGERTSCWICTLQKLLYCVWSSSQAALIIMKEGKCSPEFFCFPKPPPQKKQNVENVIEVKQENTGCCRGCWGCWGYTPGGLTAPTSIKAYKTQCPPPCFFFSVQRTVSEENPAGEKRKRVNDESLHLIHRAGWVKIDCSGFIIAVLMM